MWVLLGIGVIVAGFLLRGHPLLVVTAAVIVTGIASPLGGFGALAAFGKAFNDSRYISLVWLVLPVIGLLERHGLQEEARKLVARARGASTGRLLALYFLLRLVTAGLGLRFGGHAQMVRPLIAPMAEAAAEQRIGPLPDALRWRIRAHAAAADTVAWFFGEDIFVAVASILLVKAFLDQAGVHVQPLQLSLWAIPTAVCALVVHGARLLWLDRRIARDAAAAGAAKP